MSIIEQIRAEIERRITDNTFGAKLELMDILAWLDTIESCSSEIPNDQEPEVDLKKELDAWRHDHFKGKRDDHYSGEYLERTSQLDLARHFRSLGKGDRDTIFHKGMMYYRKQMMEEAVEAYVNTYESIPGGSYVEFVADIPASHFKEKDKVRVIILKEEE